MSTWTQCWRSQWLSGLGIRSSVFWANCSFFAKKMNEWATWGNRSCSLIFSERPERFAHIAHFWWATRAIRSHCSPKMREWANCSILKPTLFEQLLICSFIICLEGPERFAHSRSFVMSDLSVSLTVAHLILSEMSKWGMSGWANSELWWLCGHRQDYMDTFRIFWRLLTDFKGLNS